MPVRPPDTRQTALPPSYRTWFIVTVTGASLILMAVGTFNAFVDPFQQYRISSRYPPRFYDRLHRYIAPGLAKNAKYDTLISGSSIIENTANLEINRECGGTAINVALPAISASEQNLIIRTALGARPMSRVILLLDFNAFSGTPDSRQEPAGPLPAYLYDRNVFNDLPYLLSTDVLVKSFRIVIGDHTDRYSSDVNAPWWWADKRRFGQSEVLKGLDPNNLNAGYHQPQRDLTAMIKSFDANILPLFTENPKVEFDTVWPPYSILVWADFVQRRQLDLTLEFKRYVWNATRHLANVHIIDVQGIEAVTHNLDLYADIYHYAPAVNDFVVHAACGKDFLVTEKNVARLEQQLSIQALSFDTGGLLSGIHR